MFSFQICACNTLIGMSGNKSSLVSVGTSLELKGMTCVHLREGENAAGRDCLRTVWN